MTKLILALLLLLGAATACTRPYFVPAPATTAVVCHEEEPCWDCHTMGNRICGPGRG